MRAYHDLEWGVPLHDERGLFELLTLEGAQAGLSWSTILKRRDGYRGAFANFEVWSFVGGQPLDHHFTSMPEVPAMTAESEQMSRALRKRGFGFVGPTICYAFMQAAGLVNDHLANCPARSG